VFRDLDINKLDEGTLISILVVASKFRNVELSKQAIQLLKDQNIDIAPEIHYLMATCYLNARMPKEGFEYLQV
jgi:hypothetical protein